MAPPPPKIWNFHYLFLNAVLKMMFYVCDIKSYFSGAFLMYRKLTSHICSHLVAPDILKRNLYSGAKRFALLWNVSGSWYCCLQWVLFVASISLSWYPQLLCSDKWLQIFAHSDFLQILMLCSVSYCFFWWAWTFSIFVYAYSWSFFWSSSIVCNFVLKLVHEVHLQFVHEWSDWSH